MINRPAAGPVIVPFESLIDVSRPSDVVMSRIALATEDIDKPLSNAAHTG
jgi:hypothetical protein